MAQDNDKEHDYTPPAWPVQHFNVSLDEFHAKRFEEMRLARLTEFGKHDERVGYNAIFEEALDLLFDRYDWQHKKQFVITIDGQFFHSDVEPANNTWVKNRSEATVFTGQEADGFKEDWKSYNVNIEYVVE